MTPVIFLPGTQPLNLMNMNAVQLAPQAVAPQAVAPAATAAVQDLQIEFGAENEGDEEMDETDDLDDASDEVLSDEGEEAVLTELEEVFIGENIHQPNAVGAISSDPLQTHAPAQFPQLPSTVSPLEDQDSHLSDSEGIPVAAQTDQQPVDGNFLLQGKFRSVC